MSHTIKVTGITTQEYFEHYPESTQPMELINGEVIMSPAPNDDHGFIVAYLSGLLFNAVVLNELGEYRVAPNDVTFDELNTVQPDLFYISKNNTRCKRTQNKYWEGAPDLCVEILSPSTAKQDRDKKFKLYEKYGVTEYWIIDALNHTIEVYVLDNNRYHQQGVYTIEDTFTSPLIPQLTIPVAKIFYEG
jgi:Uma2 family endonuclease